jgi:hypothetical protein
MKLGLRERGNFGGYHKMKITEYDVSLQELVERTLTKKELESINEAAAVAKARLDSGL